LHWLSIIIAPVGNDPNDMFVKEVASEAARARRQRELELEVLTGTVRGWEGEPIDQATVFLN